MRVTHERFGTAELVFLNAGVGGPFASIFDVTTEQFDEIIAIDLRSVFLGLRARRCGGCAIRARRGRSSRPHRSRACARTSCWCPTSPPSTA
jgi:hypothetical protein